jgi:hypothetical protein
MAKAKARYAASERDVRRRQPVHPFAIHVEYQQKTNYIRLSIPSHALTAANRDIKYSQDNCMVTGEGRRSGAA